MPPRRAKRFSQPTPMQIASYEAVVRLGSQSDASRELQRHQGSIRADVLRYVELTGAPLPDGVSGVRRAPSAAQVLAGVPARLDAIEADIVATRAALERLTELVEGFVQRQPIVIAGVGLNRRQADGGEGGKREQRAIRRVAAG